MGDLIVGTPGILLFVMIKTALKASVVKPWGYFMTATIINLVNDTVYNVYPNATDGTLVAFC
jgi:hypothetical protein